MVDFNFRVAASAAGCWAECIVSNGAASGVTELRGFIFLCTTDTIISSFLICATSNNLEVLCKWFLCNMLASWGKVLQILWQQYRYVWHPLPLIKCPPCPPFSQSFRPLPSNIPPKQFDLLSNLSDFICHHSSYLIFNLFDHEIILMHLTDPFDLIPSTLYYNQPALFNLWHHYVLECRILLPSDWLKHLLLILSVASSRWAREWVVGVLIGRDADREGQRTD